MKRCQDCGGEIMERGDSFECDCACAFVIRPIGTGAVTGAEYFVLEAPQETPDE